MISSSLIAENSALVLVSVTGALATNTLQAEQHRVENDDVALAAGIHDARFFEHGVHVHGLGERFARHGERR